MKACTAAAMPISQTKRSRCCAWADPTTRFWGFMRLSYFSVYLLLSVFQHYWFLHALLHSKRDPRALVRGSIQHTHENPVRAGSSWAFYLEGWKVLGGGIPSLQGSLRGCRVLLPVGCSAGLGASVVVELSEGGNMTQRDFTSSYTIQWGWTPVKPKVRVVPACVRSLRGCAWTHRYEQAGKPHKIVKHIYEVWCNMQFCQWIKDLKIKHVWQVLVLTCQLGREQGDQGKVIKHF